MLLGIHSTKYEEFLFWTLSICSSTSLVDMRPREVSGVKPVKKKCRRGNGIRLTPSLRRSELSWPGNRRQHVTPDMQAEQRWLRSPYVGVVSFSVRKQISYRASLSRHMHSSAFSTSWCTESVALYGSTTVSDTLGE